MILVISVLEKLLPFEVNTFGFIIIKLLITAVGAILLYITLFYVLRSIFRKFERDIALVTLNVSAYPALAAFILFTLKITFNQLAAVDVVAGIQRILSAGLIVAISYWLIQLIKQVLIYYLKEYTQQTEVMWDDVLLPLLEAVIPVVIVLIAGVFVLRSFGVDLTGIWVTLGGATFIIGFAVKDILANFFSGIVLLIDTPFKFGDVLRLEDGSVGMLRKIGVRVTQIYMPKHHCDVYIPNSVLQGQKIDNLSRPTMYFFHSATIEVPFELNLKQAKRVMEEVIFAHPDTLGSIDHKLELIDRYYINEIESETLTLQQSRGKLRLMAEDEVNLKLEEIEQALEALVVTLQFAERGGLTQDEIENIQHEYQGVLSIIGLEAIAQTQNNRSVYTLNETRSRETLIALVRDWYRITIRDPNLLDNDTYIISGEWEHKITLLKRRVQRLYQKISHPQREETRLDDYVKELQQWLWERFKEPRRNWQEPQVLMTGTNHDEGYTYVEFKLNFFVDDIRLENGRRGDRVISQIYQEVVGYLKSEYKPL